MGGWSAEAWVDGRIEKFDDNRAGGSRPGWMGAFLVVVPPPRNTPGIPIWAMLLAHTAVSAGTASLSMDKALFVSSY